MKPNKQFLQRHLSPRQPESLEWYSIGYLKVIFEYIGVCSKIHIGKRFPHTYSSPHYNVYNQRAGRNLPHLQNNTVTTLNARFSDSRFPIRLLRGYSLT